MVACRLPRVYLYIDIHLRISRYIYIFPVKSLIATLISRKTFWHHFRKDPRNTKLIKMLVLTSKGISVYQGCRFVPCTFSETIRHRWYLGIQILVLSRVWRPWCRAKSIYNPVYGFHCFFHHLHGISKITPPPQPDWDPRFPKKGLGNERCRRMTSWPSWRVGWREQADRLPKSMLN